MVRQCSSKISQQTYVSAICTRNLYALLASTQIAIRVWCMSLCYSFPYVSFYEVLLVIKGHFWEWKSVRHKLKIWIFWKRQLNLSYFEFSIGLQIHRLTLSWSVAANKYGKNIKTAVWIPFFNTSSFSCLKMFTY